MRLTDVAPDGTSEWITDGILRASMRRVDPARATVRRKRVVRVFHPYDRAEAPPVGEPVEYFVQLADVSAVFRAGHRIRLDVLPVAGAGYDTASAPGAGVLQLLHDPSHPSRVQLPVVPARCQLAVPMLESGERLAPCAGSYRAAVGQ